VRSHRLRAPARGGGEATYSVHVLDGELAVGGDALLDWVREMTAAVVDFWHGCPVDGLALFLVPRPERAGVPFGRAMAGGAVSIVV
jgi:hypothetical protein